MRCQVRSCNKKAIWKRTSIVTKVNLCDSCRKELEKEFNDLNGLKDIQWYYYKLLD